MNALTACLKAICSQLYGEQPVTSQLAELERLAQQGVETAHRIDLQAHPKEGAEVIFWSEALRQTVAEHRQDDASLPDTLAPRLQALAERARTLAMGMDFAFLLDPERQLLSIGYSLSDNRLDNSCYDLLASEARLASLFAIAKGDVVTKHWFKLGRSATPLGQAAALISWSGSMFEYLMPSLVMRAPIGSQLECTNRLIVDLQISYGHSLDSMGIRSRRSTPGQEFTINTPTSASPAGPQRGLAENRVIAPYATGLAAMVNPGAALKLQRLAAMGGGRYGFTRRWTLPRPVCPITRMWP